MMIDLRSLCDNLPECFYEYIDYTRNLQFTQKPDYKYLKDIFINCAKHNNIELKYFWENMDTSDHNVNKISNGPKKVIKKNLRKSNNKNKKRKSIKNDVDSKDNSK